MESTIKVDTERNGSHRVSGSASGEEFSLPPFKRSENALKAALAIQQCYRHDNRAQSGDEESTLEVNLST